MALDRARRRLLSAKQFNGADTAFHVPAGLLGAETAAQGQPAFVNRYAYRSVAQREPQPGANHGDEVAYVFGTPEGEAPFGPEDRAVSDLLAGYWTQFARTGDPNGGGLPTGLKPIRS